METTKIEIKGTLAEDFLSFIEDQKMDPQSPYQSAIIEEKERNVGDGKRATIGAVVLLLLTLAQDLVKDLIKDFLKDKLNNDVNSAKYKLINDKGEELEIILNKLDLSEVEHMIDKFRGNIVEVHSTN